jgi:hypothetical protein
MFFLNVSGLLLVLFILVPHAGLKEEVPQWAYMIISLASSFALVMGLIYFVDFITFGWVKKQRWLAPLYRPIYLIFSALSLAFIYRRAYYAYATNAPKWSLLLSIFGAFVLALFITVTTTDSLPGAGMIVAKPREVDSRFYIEQTKGSYYADPLHYDNLRKPGQLVDYASIPGRVVEGPL